MAFKVLFVYPNHGSELRIPLAISILVSAIKNAGHDVKLFDTTFMGEFKTDNDAMVKLGTHQQTNLNDLVGETKQINPKQELCSTIEQYKPDLICVSLVERNLNEAKELLKDVNAPVIVGGIMPTIAPEYFKNQDWVDMICVGEGEQAIIDIIEKGTYTPSLTSMDKIPEQDWTLFDRRHLLKPFMGKVYTGGAFELSRGCFKSCTFCVAPKLREVQQGLGCYHRTKTPHTCIREIEHKIKDYNLEMIAFSDTDFLSGVPKKTMKEFLTLYKDRVNLPFTMQASVQTLLDEDILSLLRQAQCCAVSVGVESGSERIQKTVLKKVIPYVLLKKAFDLCRKHELRVTANYMIGLPFETEEDVRETIELNRKVNPPSIAVTFFTPFMGTELYDVCIKNGFYKPFTENVYEYPPLDMKQFPQDKIKQMVKEFTENFKSYQDDFNIL